MWHPSQTRQMRTEFAFLFRDEEIIVTPVTTSLPPLLNSIHIHPKQSLSVKVVPSPLPAPLSPHQPPGPPHTLSLGAGCLQASPLPNTFFLKPFHLADTLLRELGCVIRHGLGFSLRRCQASSELSEESHTPLPSQHGPLSVE